MKNGHLSLALLSTLLLMGCASQKSPARPVTVSAPADSHENPPASSQSTPPVDPPATTPTAAAAAAPEESSAEPAADEEDIDTAPPPAPPQNVDPYEKFNRAMFAFNDKLDHWILRPIAKTYDYVTPTPIHKGVTNFFDNIDMLTTIPNDLLQAKFAYFTADMWRFILNTTFGIGGIFDMASRAGLPKHHEDFGMTLAYWGGADGLKPQPYLVLPFIGSTTTRDAFAKIPAAATWPFNYIEPQYYSYGAFALDMVNKRASLLPADKLVQDAFDPYIFVRSAYLQSRNHELEKNRHETNFAPYTTETENPPTDEDNAGNEL